MNYRAVAGWGQLPEGWSFVEATSVTQDLGEGAQHLSSEVEP
jgi:hypothetical protein